MLILSDAPFAARRLCQGAVAVGLLLGMTGVMGCRSERRAAAEADVVTRMEMVRPATERGRVGEPASARVAAGVGGAAATARVAAGGGGVAATARVAAGGGGVAASATGVAVHAATDDVATLNADVAAEDSVEELAKYCRKVELQARDTNASLPKRLDKDTKATRVEAFGCDVVLEYAMLDLRVGDVAFDGMRALRRDALEKLCTDAGARGVLNHGGSFTNVYRDERSALIDQFTIAEADCWSRPAPDGARARNGL